MKSLQAAGVITAQIKSYWLPGWKKKKKTTKNVLKWRPKSQSRLIFQTRGTDAAVRTYPYVIVKQLFILRFLRLSALLLEMDSRSTSYAEIKTGEGGLGRVL